MFLALASVAGPALQYDTMCFWQLDMAMAMESQLAILPAPPTHMRPQLIHSGNEKKNLSRVRNEKAARHVYFSGLRTLVLKHNSLCTLGKERGSRPSRPFAVDLECGPS